MYTFDKSNLAGQRRFFDDNGFMVVRDVLLPKELAEFGAMIDGAMDGTLLPEQVHADSPACEFSIQWEPTNGFRVVRGK